MLKIKKGIALNPMISDGWARVSINSGTLPYREQDLRTVTFQNWNFIPLFHDKAVVPKHDWRELTSAERSILVGTAHQCYNAVTLGDTTIELKELFDQLQITDLTSREAVLNRIRSKPILVKAMSEVMQQFLLPMSQNRPFHFHCIAANLPNLELVACDVRKLPPNFTIPERIYEGLHNDGTKSMRIHTMHTRGNRMTINLGKESRIFYFTNLTLRQAYQMLKATVNQPQEKITSYNIAPLFFKTFPDYPVVKIIQKPYEYYIAPTDNCFHDGSTLGNSALDINMVYFGSFAC